MTGSAFQLRGLVPWNPNTQGTGQYIIKGYLSTNLMYYCIWALVYHNKKTSHGCLGRSLVLNTRYWETSHLLKKNTQFYILWDGAPSKNYIHHVKGMSTAQLQHSKSAIERKSAHQVPYIKENFKISLWNYNFITNIYQHLRSLLIRLSQAKRIDFVEAANWVIRLGSPELWVPDHDKSTNADNMLGHKNHDTISHFECWGALDMYMYMGNLLFWVNIRIETYHARYIWHPVHDLLVDSRLSPHSLLFLYSQPIIRKPTCRK